MTDVEASTGPHARPAPTPERDVVVDVRGLRMSYGTYDAVRGVDLQVRRGEIFAFLGPNGAGKTTTVEILEGFRVRTGGDVSVLGEDPQRASAAWRSRIGVVLQESEPERDLTVAECLRLYAGYYPSPRDVDEVVALVGLTEKRDAIATRMSGGERRRLDVALALIGDPELVFLDEPTTGFDPNARRAAWDMINGLRDLGVTVFLTTHYMDEAEHLADRVAVLAQGQILAEGTPATLGGRDRSHVRVTFTPPPGVHTDALPPALQARVVASSPLLTLAAESPLEVLGPLLAWAETNGYDLADLSVNRPSLEDIYIELTGRETTLSAP
jgi:ABC-2 type transport system ATP-binding protein